MSRRCGQRTLSGVEWSSTGRWMVLAGIACAVAGCDGDEPVGSGAFLHECTTTAECAGALTCECGVCTRACTAASECTDLRSSATCRPSSEVPACGGGAPPSVCVVACSVDGDCDAGETCEGGTCVEPRLGDGGMDAAVDGEVPDGGAIDVGPVACTPNAWFCDPSGVSTHYCNATGDGIVRTMSCRGEACADGFCAPSGYNIDGLCGLLVNGWSGDIIGSCLDHLTVVEHDYPIWLARGDTVRIHAEAISPLVSAEVTISHPCEAGSVMTCETVELSPPGGSIDVERTAPYRETIRIQIREIGSTDGSRLAARIELVPGEAPPLPEVCDPAAPRTCTGSTQTYCSDDGAFARSGRCAFDELSFEVCAGDACAVPAGETCADAIPIVRPPTDELHLSAVTAGLNDDYDPGSQCFGLGQSGADRVYRLDLTAGERVRITGGFSGLYSYGLHSLYLMRDCADVASSCIAGSLGHRSLTESGYVRTFPELRYLATADETIYLVADREAGVDMHDVEATRSVTIRWDGTCVDGVMNGDETGIDCGGPCPGCTDGLGCRVPADCESRRCERVDRRLICTRPAGCGDALFGTGEECDDGNTDDDDFCSNACVVARCDDGVRNGDETAIDAGGYCALPVRETCASAYLAPIVFESPGVVAPYLFEWTLAGATDDHTPTCSAGAGVDHAYRVWVDTRTELSLFLASTMPVSDPTRTMTLSITRDCGGPEIACDTATGAFVELAQTLDPGWYIVWVDETGPTGSAYELAIQ